MKINFTCEIFILHMELKQFTCEIPCEFFVRGCKVAKNEMPKFYKSFKLCRAK